MVYSASEESDLEAEEEDSTLADLPDTLAPPAPRGRRQSVSAECVDPDNLEVRTIRKTPQQMARLEDAIGQVECNLFFMKNINPEQRQAIRDAMEEKRFEGNYELLSSRVAFHWRPFTQHLLVNILTLL